MKRKPSPIGVLYFIASLIALGALYYLQDDQRKRIAELQTLNTSLQIENALLKKNKGKAITISNTDQHHALEPQKTAESTSSHESTPHHSHSKPENQFTEQMVNMRVNAISQFTDLDESQKQRLRDKFEVDLSGGGESERLKDILGEDQWRFYREERTKAYERSKREAREQNIYYLSRKLELSPEQEQFVFSAFDEVDVELKEWKKDQESLGTSSRARMLAYFEAERHRRALLQEKMKDILSQQQYENYLEQDANSSEADMQLWHNPAGQEE